MIIKLYAPVIFSTEPMPSDAPPMEVLVEAAERQLPRLFMEDLAEFIDYEDYKFTINTTQLEITSILPSVVLREAEPYVCFTCISELDEYKVDDVSKLIAYIGELVKFLNAQISDGWGEAVVCQSFEVDGHVYTISPDSVDHVTLDGYMCNGTSKIMQVDFAKIDNMKKLVTAYGYLSLDQMEHLCSMLIDRAESYEYWGKNGDKEMLRQTFKRFKVASEWNSTGSFPFTVLVLDWNTKRLKDRPVHGVLTKYRKYIWSRAKDKMRKK